MYMQTTPPVVSFVPLPLQLVIGTVIGRELLVDVGDVAEGGRKAGIVDRGGCRIEVVEGGDRK